MKRQKNKQEKTENKETRNAPREPKSVERDWQPLFAAFKDVTDWALDIAVQLSRDIPEDVKAIEEVRSFVHAWVDGRHCDVPLTDVLLTIGTILAAIEIDLGVDTVSMLSPLDALVERPSQLPPAEVLRLYDELTSQFAA